MIYVEDNTVYHRNANFLTLDHGQNHPMIDTTIKNQYIKYVSFGIYSTVKHGTIRMEDCIISQPLVISIEDSKSKNYAINFIINYDTCRIEE